MKIRLFVILLFLIVFAKLQADTVFYSNGIVYVTENSSGDNTSMYIKGDIQLESNTSFYHYSEGLVKLTGDFLNNVIQGNIFTADSEGLFEFCGTDIQNIKGSADKVQNYVNFYKVRVNNPASVQLDSKMSMNVEELDLTKGRFVLLSGVSTDVSTQVECAHLLVNEGGNVIYNRDAADVNDKGVVEVQLSLGDNYQNKKIVGFSSPFKRIYADYFTFNFLTKPSPSGLFGDNNLLINDILTPMNAGEGYLLGQGIIQDDEHYWQNVNNKWPDLNYNERFTDTLSFARDFMPQSFSQYNTQADRFSGEEINITDVDIPLTRRGFNYVGNPFTVPIDLSTFVQSTDVADEWGVTRGEAGVGELRNSFYVVSGGSGEYNADATDYKFTFNVSYLLGQAVGGTLSYDGSPSLLIAPMQMFVVGKNQDGASNFKIPASARTHGLARFFRSSFQTVDEIMIETIDEDTKGYDRLCVVFRDGASLKSNDSYDANKLFNYSKGVNQIYTQSSDNKKMTTNVISPETESIDIYLVPPHQGKNVTLNAYRLNSLQSVNTVLLEDKFTGTVIDLLQNPTYSFRVNPTDNENRFTLHFVQKNTTQDNLINQFPLIVYTQSKQIKINGLTDGDLGSDVYVFDVNGRIIHKEKVNEISEDIINTYFVEGVYIVKITGNRNIVDKVIVN